MNKTMSVTKTFRFPNEIDHRLRRAAQQLGRKPNAILMSALQDYLDRLEHRDLQSEARRQSLLVSRELDQLENAAQVVDLLR